MSTLSKVPVALLLGALLAALAGCGQKGDLYLPPPPPPQEEEDEAGG